MPMKYDKLFALMKEKGLTTYRIRQDRIITETTLQKLREGFAILTPERLDVLAGGSTVNTDFGPQPRELKFLGAVGKRKDSPGTTDIYDLQVGGLGTAWKYASKQMVEIEPGREPGTVTVTEAGTWRKYSFSMEEEDG